MDKGSLTTRNEFINLQSKASTQRGPIDREAARLESSAKKLGSVSDTECPAWARKSWPGAAMHTGKQNSEHQRQRKLGW